MKVTLDFTSRSAIPGRVHLRLLNEQGGVEYGPVPWRKGEVLALRSWLNQSARTTMIRALRFERAPQGIVIIDHKGNPYELTHDDVQLAIEEITLLLC